MKEEKQIKCVVWDLDGTIWHGILLESENVRLKPDIKQIIQMIDARGILHSIASKNNYADAMKKLREFGLDEYFLYPEIGWNAKSSSIAKIQKNLNIGRDAMMFIDDQAFERCEVQYLHPGILCIDASEYSALPDHPRLNPKFITQDSIRRRLMYIEDMQRRKTEEEYVGPKKEFLSSLNIEFAISKAKEEDLKRAEELTVRTNQLNATGRTYSYEELRSYIYSDSHELLVCEMKDKFGSYGKVGLALIEMNNSYWCLKLLLMSCRVISYGVGSVLLCHIMQESKKEKMKLLADFRHTERNRMMYITFKMANFKVVQSKSNGKVILENDLSIIQKFPPFINVNVSD